MMEVTGHENYSRFCENSRGTRKARNIHATVKFRDIVEDFISLSLVLLVSSRVELQKLLVFIYITLDCRSIIPPKVSSISINQCGSPLNARCSYIAILSSS
jgi:hypothetical protein